MEPTSCSSSLFKHDLRTNAFRVCREGKPVSTFPDHALGTLSTPNAAAPFHFGGCRPDVSHSLNREVALVRRALRMSRSLAMPDEIPCASSRGRCASPTSSSSNVVFLKRRRVSIPLLPHMQAGARSVSQLRPKERSILSGDGQRLARAKVANCGQLASPRRERSRSLQSQLAESMALT